MNTLLLYITLGGALLQATAGPDVEVISRAQKKAGVALESDPVLARGAACLAKYARKGQALSAALVRHCADLTGVYESVLVPLVGEAGNSSSLTHAIEVFFRDEAKVRKLTHYGAANARDDGSQTLAVLASQRRGSFALAPADACASKRVHFSGEVEPGHSRLRAFLTLPNGKTETLTLTQKGRAYQGEAAVASKGRYQLEVLGDSKEGPHVIANRAMFVCTKPPDTPPSAVENTGVPTAEQMLALINGERRRSGLQALALDARLGRVASAHAEDMRAHNFFAHSGRDGSTLGERLKRARIAYLRATENLSSAPTAQDAHTGLMGSPGHRQNIVDPEVTQVGVGIVAAPLSNGAPNYLFVIDFTLPQVPVNAVTFADTLLSTLNQERARAHLRPLTRDQGLDSIATAHSQAMAKKDALAYTPNEERFTGEVRAQKGNVDLDTDLFLTNDAGSLRKSQNVGKAARAVGLGVVQGSSKRYGADIFWVTVIYLR